MCPRCGRPGRIEYQGYCTRSHRDLDRKPQKVRLECVNCGRPVIRSSHQVTETGRVFCKRCPKNSGEHHYKWREGRYQNPAGYWLILVQGSYILEHIYVWQQINKASVLKESGAHVHHVNMDKGYNEPDNLLLLSPQEHGRVHRLMVSQPRRALELLNAAGNRQLWYPKEILNLNLGN